MSVIKLYNLFISLVVTCALYCLVSWVFNQSLLGTVVATVGAHQVLSIFPLVSQYCQQLPTPNPWRRLTNLGNSISSLGLWNPWWRKCHQKVSSDHPLHPELSPAILTVSCHWIQVTLDESVRLKLNNSPSLQSASHEAITQSPVAFCD